MGRKKKTSAARCIDRTTAEKKAERPVRGTSFTPAEQDAVFDMLSRGASPAVACRHLGRSLADFFETLNTSPEFRERVQSVQIVLGQNVAAALYKSAMEGNVTAQTFWLRNSPPPAWKGDESGSMNDPFEELSDEELIELARAQGIDLPPEIEAALESKGGPPLSQRLPAPTETDQ